VSGSDRLTARLRRSLPLTVFAGNKINQKTSDTGKFVFAVNVFFDDVKHKIIKSAKSPGRQNQKQKPDERKISGEKINGR
jgi:hypothetical protein